jgi:hypothetical protein
MRRYLWVSGLSVVLAAGCGTQRATTAGVEPLRVAEHGYLRSGAWSAAEVRMTLVRMAADYGWVHLNSREDSLGVKGAGFYLAQFHRSLRTKDGLRIDLHVLEESDAGVRVFVSSEPWEPQIIQAVAEDLAARIDRRAQGLGPLGPHERLK